MGEVAAAHVAGALGLADAARVVCRRSRLLRRLSGQGAMLAVELPLDEAAAAIRGMEDRVAVAVSNGPRSTVLSGERESLAAVLEALDKRGVFGRWVQVDVASHSPQIDVLEEDLLFDLTELKPGTLDVPLYSTVTGRSISGEALGAAYWFENVRRPVLFGAAAKRLLEDGTTAFLELSPHPVLTLAAVDAAREAQRDAVALASQRRDTPQQESALIALGGLFVHGCTVDWRRLYSSPRRVVSLPAYPWQRERFWTEVPAGARSVAERSHPLLARYLRSGVQPRTHHWEVDLSSQDFPFLQDHRVRNQALLPAAGYAEIALAAACALGMQSPALEEVTLDEALFVPDGVVTTAQVVMTVGAKDGVDVGVDGRASFEFVSMPNGREGATVVRRHARGYVRDVMDKNATRELGQSGEPPSAIQARCHQRVSNERHYAVMAERELSYGPAFRGVGELWRRDGESLARLTLPPQIAAEAHRYRVHPALLDACFQTLWAAVPSSDDRPVQENTFLNVGFEALRARTQPVMPPHGELWAHGTIAVDTGSTDTVIGDVRLLDGTGNVLMEARGVRHRRVGGASVTGDPVAGWFYGMEWHRTPPTRNAPDAATGTALVFGLGDGFSAAVIAELGQRGLAHVLVRPGSSFARPTPRQAVVRPGNREDIEALLRGVGNCRAVVHLWSAGEPPERDPSGLEAAQRVGAYSALAMAQALGAAADSGVGSVPRLWLVTSGVQVVDEGVAESAPTGDSDAVSAGLAGAPLWGLGRVIAHEFPALRRVNVDLAPNSAGEQAEMVGALCDELVAPESEDDEIALRHTGRYVARLARRSQSTLQSPSTFARIRRGDGSAGPVRLVTSAPGVLDRLEVEPAVRRAPGRGEVEIEVQRAALNFTDVMKALGVYPGARGEVWFGNECAGTVSAVGDGVSELAVGDRVVALAAGSLASHTVTRADLVARAPENLSAEEAATLPIAYVTAHYALCHLARLERGERVLIHAAAGGVGLAAVRIALHLGAEVYATAGRSEKRDHLRALGVQHVMDSRSLDFADEVKRLTDKRGVDVVLNSLAGEAIEKSLACLAPFGRFIELGKVDIYEERPLSLWPFHKNLTFSAVDLDAVGRERPELLAALLREVMELVALGAYVPLPHRVYALEDSVEAFRCMAQADHIGRILLAPPAGGAGGANDASAPRFSGDAAYLVVGGMGGLGLKVARWMVDEGARSLVLVGRGRPSDAAEVEMEALRARGADVRAVTADVADSDQVGELLVAIDRRGRPLKGIIHAAAVLDDGVLAHQTPERFEPVLAPKVTGAWNLHRLTLDRDLEFFVLFSSAASLVGSPGQGNYAAANAFLDALASFRRARNLPALAINWGPWAEVGLAAAQTNRGERLASEGAPNMAPPEALRALRAVMDPRYSGASQVGIMDMRWERWAANHPTVARSPLLAGLVRRGEGAPPANAVAPESRQESGSLVEYLRAQVGRVLRLDPARVSDTVPLIEYGLDSLMSIELRNRLEADLHVSVPLVRLLRGGTIEQLAAQLQDQPASPPGAPVPPAAPSASIVTNGHAPPRVNAPAAIGALAHHPNVVPLHVSGEGPAFFCVAPIMGVAFPYRTLARQVGEALSAPFLGLQPLGLEGEAPPSRSVEEMAECYVSAVRAVQPHGPYFLGGWSFGSMVAFELALQLSAAGEVVALLASIDSPAPGKRPSVLAAANFFVNTVGRGIWPYLGDYLALRGAAGSARASWRTVAEGAVLSSSLPREAQQLLAQSPAVRPMMDVYLASVRASWDYRPREWGGRVTLLRTERRSDRIRRDERSDPTWGWDKLVRGGVDVVSIPGRHMLVLQEPHVDVLSARLVDCIRAAREAFHQDTPASCGAPGPGAGLEAVHPASSSHSMV